jgi:hypothetical protein
VWRLREGWARLPIGVRFMWLLLGVMVGLMTLLLGVGYRLLQRSLEAQQQLVQRQRLEAVVSALERELAALLRQVQDYTVWDDAYTALSQRDTAWIRRNITEWLPKQFHYDFAVVMDSQGTVVERAGGDWEWICQTELFQRAMRGVGSAALHRHGRDDLPARRRAVRRRGVLSSPSRCTGGWQGVGRDAAPAHQPVGGTHGWGGGAFESPLTPTLSPLYKGGEGVGVGGFNSLLDMEPPPRQHGATDCVADC